MKSTLSIVAAQYAKCGLPMPAFAPAVVAPKRLARIDGVYRSKLERDFARYLSILQHAGEIRRWRYEPRRWKLGGRRRITIDFAVWGWKGKRRRVLMETKGFLWARDGVRLDFFVAMHPRETLIVVTRERGGWVFMERTDARTN